MPLFVAEGPGYKAVPEGIGLRAGIPSVEWQQAGSGGPQFARRGGRWESEQGLASHCYSSKCVGLSPRHNL